MKFVCDKCKTKYSIADEKVRRKVLKIRCKNCANIIVVRDPSRREGDSLEGDSFKGDRGVATRGTDALEQAFDGAFSSPAPAPAPRARRGSSGFRPLAAVARASAPELVADEFVDEDEAERTRLSGSMETYRPGDEPEDEWYLTVDAHQFGPMSFEELGSRVKRGEARGDDAYVWRDGFDDWIDVARVPELRPFTPPPPPPSRSGLFPVSDIDSKLPMPPAPVPPVPGFDRPAAGAGVPRPTGPQGGRSATPVPAPMPAPPRAPVPPPRPPAPTIPQGVAMAIPAPQPPAPLAPAQPDFGPVPAFDAAISQLPAAYGDRPDMTMAPVMPATGGGKTPALIKVAAIAGILSTLTGIAILVYFLVFDRPQQRVQQPTLAQLTTPGKQAQPTKPVPAPAVKPDAGNVQLEFPPVDVDRSPRGARPKRGSRPVAKRPAVVKEPGGKKLTAAQRRLLERMGGRVGATVPHATAGQKRHAGPSRNISGNEIGRLQRVNHAALKACYQRSLKRDDSLKEIKAVIQINVVPSGIVRSVSISGVSDFQLRTCLQRNVKRWTFKPLGGSETKTIEFSMSFRGS